MANWVWLHYLCTNLETLCNGHFIDFTVKIIRISHQKNARSPVAALATMCRAIMKKLYILITHHIYPVAAFARRAASEN